MIMRYGLLISTAIILLIVSFNCKSPTAPKSNNPPDTTSNNFTFQTFTFGNTSAGSSYLNDVAIINDTDIWAVGAVYLTDSTGKPDPFPYNAVHWDGKSWNLIKIAVQTSYGKVIAPFYGIYAFSANDIWISSGVPIHGDGQTWTQYNLFDMGVLSQNDGYLTKIFGTSSTDLYFVGTKGTIAFYNGIWQKIESGTTTKIGDIWGANGTILCAVSNKATPGDLKILKVSSTNTVDSISWNTGREVQSIWFSDTSKVFACGDGVFIRGANRAWTEQKSLPSYYSNRIRGIANNDVIVCGDYGLLAHYNGVSWVSYNLPNALSLVLSSLDFKRNTVVVTGYDGSNAYIIMGKR